MANLATLTTEAWWSPGVPGLAALCTHYANTGIRLPPPHLTQPPSQISQPSTFRATKIDFKPNIWPLATNCHCSAGGEIKRLNNSKSILPRIWQLIQNILLCHFTKFLSFKSRMVYKSLSHSCSSQNKINFLGWFIFLMTVWQMSLRLVAMCRRSWLMTRDWSCARMPSNWHSLCHIAVHFHPQWDPAENGSSLWCSHNQPIRDQKDAGWTNGEPAAGVIARCWCSQLVWTEQPGLGHLLSSSGTGRWQMVVVVVSVLCCVNDTVEEMLARCWTDAVHCLLHLTVNPSSAMHLTALLQWVVFK